MRRRCMHLARTVYPEVHNDLSYVFVDEHQSERASDWGLRSRASRHTRSDTANSPVSCRSTSDDRAL